MTLTTRHSLLRVILAISAMLVLVTAVSARSLRSRSPAGSGCAAGETRQPCCDDSTPGFCCLPDDFVCDWHEDDSSNPEEGDDD